MEHDVYAQQRVVAGERAVEKATYATKFMVCNQACVSNLEGKRMTDTQFLVVIGTIWIAPHVNKYYAQITGSIIICIAACKGLGWI